MIKGANTYFIAFNRYLIQKNTTKYSKSQQTTEAEAGHFLYFDCKTPNFSCAKQNANGPKQWNKLCNIRFRTVMKTSTIKIGLPWNPCPCLTEAWNLKNSHAKPNNVPELSHFSVWWISFFTISIKFFFDTLKQNKNQINVKGRILNTNL